MCFFVAVRSFYFWGIHSCHSSCSRVVNPFHNYIQNYRQNTPNTKTYVKDALFCPLGELEDIPDNGIYLKVKPYKTFLQQLQE